MDFNKLSLGTATFGMEYGAFNPSGKVPIEQVDHILSLAEENNINSLDTAIAYGDSEAILGKLGVSNWKITSKIPQVPSSTESLEQLMHEEVCKSLERLGISQLYGLLLHKPADLMGINGKQIWLALQRLKRSGLVRKIGYSVYETSELDVYWSKFKPDIVQAPMSIIDRRLIQSGWLTKLNLSGCEVHVRSIFLQGLLLTENDHIPNYFNSWKPLFINFHKWLLTTGLTRLKACLGFALSQQEVSSVIVGVNSLKQLEDILSTNKLENYDYPEHLAAQDPNLLNPSNWRIS